jgi:phage gp29-like protein
MWSEFVGWVRKMGAPPPSTDAPIVVAKPLHEQYQRIGGGITPVDVSEILRQADAGQPARLVDLMNESRQKDGHLQGVMSTRDRAVSLVELDFVQPEDANRAERKAADLCKRIRDEFRNWPLLIQHLNGGGYTHGHATAEIRWENTDDGFLLPVECMPIHARDFIFSRTDGSLRYRRTRFDAEGVDLLAENPGRIVQLQRRIVGDVPAREGLARLLVWGALFRNWDMRDWLALGEYGWKPWRLGQYETGAPKGDVDALVRALEQIGSQGVAVYPKGTSINVEWPKGISGGSQGASTHAELFDTLGRELSKAVLGQTTTTEAGPNGDRASTETRDQVRMDIREEDCVSVAAALRYHLFMPAIAANIAGRMRVPVALFQTEEATDRRDFAQAVKLLRDAGLRIPAKWVRDELGMPEPSDEDELLSPVQVPPVSGPEEPDDGNPQEDPAQEEDGDKKAA